MKLTVNIKEQSKVTAFLKLLRDLEYIEIVTVQEEEQELSEEHKQLLDERLKRIENGETSFKDWDRIKKKYENNAV